MFNLVIDTVSSLYVMIVLMRFILQLSRADFYNPISQFVVKATNPLLITLRRLIPGIAGIDLASLVLAILVQTVAVGIKVAVLGYAISNPINIVLLSAILVASFLIKIYFWSLIIMIVASWIAPGSGHPALLLINQITEPLMKPFRKILPAMGGLDLSPIFAFLTLQVLETVVSHLMRMI
ncbi:hypothetical protein A3735_19280 [Oleiphilus sp. HI0061]|uniref:YggT family protein n=1 Tax=Oleiphilus sp. HI0061 TaxID=1822239 RepID=UPI0007CF7699|nr:YggT family protein [Oleiphilus sp. HI0061]KZY56902.1 hypothetical protein A3735_19280 [Oleiphilus sp. HI0061]